MSVAGCLVEDSNVTRWIVVVLSINRLVEVLFVLLLNLLCSLLSKTPKSVRGAFIVGKEEGGSAVEE